MMENFEFTHAPDADLDYGFDWRKNSYLKEGETVNASAWAISPAGTLTRQQIINSESSVFVAGLRLNTDYQLTNTITTSAGRTDSRTIQLSCRKR
jgi:hypothetical protein